MYYLPGEKARAGSALGEIADFAGSIVTLPLGDRTLDIGSIRLAAASPVELAFSDIDVRGADVVLDRLELADVTVQKRS